MGIIFYRCVAKKLVLHLNQPLVAPVPQFAVADCYKGRIVLGIISAFLAAIHVSCRRRAELTLEVLALRQQVDVFKRKRPRPGGLALVVCLDQLASGDFSVRFTRSTAGM